MDQMYVTERWKKSTKTQKNAAQLHQNNKNNVNQIQN